MLIHYIYNILRITSDYCIWWDFHGLSIAMLVQVWFQRLPTEDGLKLAPTMDQPSYSEAEELVMEHSAIQTTMDQLGF